MKKNLSMIGSGMLCMACYITPASAELSTEVVYTTTYTSGQTAGPLLGASNDLVAWVENNGLKYWDGQTIQTIGYPYVNFTGRYDVYNGTIAWIGKKGYGGAISVFYWDGTYDANAERNIQEIAPITLIPNTGNNQFGLSLYDGKIAWNSSDGNDYEIYLWDGTYNNGQPNISQITNNSDFDQAPSMADGMIAWRGGEFVSQSVRYWDGSSVQELNGSPVMWDSVTSVSTSNGAIAWRGYPDQSIYYWDGTFSGGSPNIVAAATKGFPLDRLSDPSLHNGKISYIKHDSSRSEGTDEAVFYWNGADTLQISEWYDLYTQYVASSRARPITTDNGVAYVGTNATSGYHEIRFVTSTGLCL
jgi:hypothetical protein